MPPKSLFSNWTRGEDRPCRIPLRYDEMAESDLLKVVNVSFWFDHLLIRTGALTAYALETLIEHTDSDGKRKSDRPKRNKWPKYARGLHAPRRSLLVAVEVKVPGSIYIFDHPLWVALAMDELIGNRAEQLIRQLSPSIQEIVLRSIAAQGGGLGPLQLRRLERRAGLDSLACLTILIRLAHERGDNKNLLEMGRALYNVLLMFCTSANAERLSELFYRLFRDRIFPLCVSRNRGIRLENFNFSDRVHALKRLASPVERPGAELGSALWLATVTFSFAALHRLNTGMALTPTIGPHPSTTDTGSADDEAEASLLRSLTLGTLLDEGDNQAAFHIAISGRRKSTPK